MYSIKQCQEEREKASLGFSFFIWICVNPWYNCIYPIFPYSFLILFNCPLLCIYSIFCLFMDFSFVYFSVVLGSLWRVIWTVFVDNLGAEGVRKPLIWLRLWISGVGFEIAPENGEKVEITLCPFFLFLFSLVLRFFLAFCSGWYDFADEILIVLCFL